MRTLLLCLTLMLASVAVGAEHPKSPEKITKTTVVKRAPQPVVAQGSSSQKSHQLWRVKTDSRGFPEKGRLQNATEACWREDAGKTCRQAVGHNGHQNRGVKASDEAAGKAC